MLRMNYMYFGSPLDFWDLCGKADLSYVCYIIRQGKAKQLVLELTPVFHHLLSVGPKQLSVLAHLGSSGCFRPGQDVPLDIENSLILTTRFEIFIALILCKQTRH